VTPSTPFSVVLAVVFALAPSRAPLCASIEEVVDCARSSLPPAAHGRFLLRWRSAQGEQREVEGSYWAEQPAAGARRVIVASSSGRPEQRAAYLFSEGDAVGEAWLWMPDQKSARRIMARGSEGELFGTDLSFEDFARFARISFPGQLRRLDDATIGGRPVYVVETKPAPDSGSEYSKIVTSLDKELCVVLRRECYQAGFEAGAKPRKLLSVDPKNVKREKGFARATKALLQDQQDGSETRVQLVDLDLDAKLPEGFFRPENLAETAK
jgi:hypothetical protein